MSKQKKARLIEESIKRVQIHNRRYYEIREKGTKDLLGVYPSVTTILSATTDKSGLDKWRARIGEEAANKISVEATDRGTVMHRLCEIYLNLPSELEPYDRLQATLDLARTDKEIAEFDTRAHIVGGQLFHNFVHSNSFTRVDETIIQEQFLWTSAGGGYAGTVDNFSLLDDGSYKVIDFKTSRKPKPEKYIENYKKQVSAYGVAIWDRMGIKPDGAEIWISNEKERHPQVYLLSWYDMQEYFKKFVEENLKVFHQQHSIDEYIDKHK